jgi:hypothetical protein
MLMQQTRQVTCRLLADLHVCTPYTDSLNRNTNCYQKPVLEVSGSTTIPGNSLVLQNPIICLIKRFSNFFGTNRDCYNLQISALTNILLRRWFHGTDQSDWLLHLVLAMVPWHWPIRLTVISCFGDGSMALTNHTDCYILFRRWFHGTDQPEWLLHLVSAMVPWHWPIRLTVTSCFGDGSMALTNQTDCYILFWWWFHGTDQSDWLLHLVSVMVPWHWPIILTATSCFGDGSMALTNHTNRYILHGTDQSL